MIQDWLGIRYTFIRYSCGLSQCSGSSTKRPIQLDGAFNFNIIVPKFQGVLMNSEFKVVVADESHFLKNAQAKRTNATGLSQCPLLGMIIAFMKTRKAKYVILLSGTPALSRPVELFKQGVFGVYQGASNHEELHNLMKATVMNRRLKKDVLSKLPVKRHQLVFLELEEKQMIHVKALFRELELIKSKINASNCQEEVESLKFSQKNLINKIYTESAEAKISAVLDYLGTIIEFAMRKYEAG